MNTKYRLVKIGKGNKYEIDWPFNELKIEQKITLFNGKLHNTFVTMMEKSSKSKVMIYSIYHLGNILVSMRTTIHHKSRGDYIMIFHGKYVIHIYGTTEAFIDVFNSMLTNLYTASCYLNFCKLFKQFDDKMYGCESSYSYYDENIGNIYIMKREFSGYFIGEDSTIYEDYTNNIMGYIDESGKIVSPIIRGDYKYRVSDTKKYLRSGNKIMKFDPFIKYCDQFSDICIIFTT